MQNGKVFVFKFDGIFVARGSKGKKAREMVAIPGAIKLARILKHKGLDVVALSDRDDKDLTEAQVFLKISDLNVRIVTKGNLSRNPEKITTSMICGMVSDDLSELLPINGVVKNLFWLNPDHEGDSKTGQTYVKRVGTLSAVSSSAMSTP